MHLRRLFHELTGSIDRIVIEGREVGLSSLSHSLHVQHVLRTLFVSFVNKEHVLEFLDANIPGVDSSC